MDDHKHLREIDCSLAATWAMALNLGVNQYTGPAISAKACFWWQSTTNVNKGRQAWPMSGLFILMSMWTMNKENCQSVILIKDGV